jgi:hypothetical protein
MARKVAEKLGLPGTGGSDAHRVDEIATWLTDFEKDIEDENELLHELHAGRFRAVQYTEARGQIAKDRGS